MIIRHQLPKLPARDRNRFSDSLFLARMVLFWAALLLIGNMPQAGASASVTDWPAAGKDNLTNGFYRIFLPAILKDHPHVVVVDQGGGNVSWPEGNLVITFPAGAFNTPVTLYLSLASSVPASLYDFGQTIRIEAFDPSGNPITQLNKPAILTFTFNDPDYWIPPRLTIYSQQGQEAWLPLSTFYGPAPNQFYARTGHLSSFGLLGTAAGDFRKMAADSAGKVYFFVGPVVYRQTPGAADQELYFDFSTVFGSPTTSGDLAIDTVTNDLYIGNSNKVYKLTPSKQLTNLHTVPFSGNFIQGLHFSPYYHSLFVSSIYNTYQINPADGGLVNTFSPSKDVVTDTIGGIFFLSQAAEITDDWPVEHSSIGYWSNSDPQVKCILPIRGFLKAGRLAMDVDDQILVPNSGADAVSIVGGDEIVVTGSVRVPRPENTVVSGASLVIASRGGLKIVPVTQRNSSTASPYLLTEGSISGKGSLIQVGGVDPVPAHNLFRLNGKVQRNIISFGRNGVITFDLTDYANSCDFPITPTLEPFYSDPLDPYSAPVHAYHLSVGEAPSSSGLLAVPEPGNWKFVDTYSENHIARGAWGVFNSTKVVASDGLFPDWQGGTAPGGLGLAYQFNQLGRFRFIKNNSETFYVNVTPGGNLPGCQGSGVLHIDPSAGTIFRFNGAILEVPPGALPETALYMLEMSVCNSANPGKDTLTASSYNYQVKITPDPPQLLQPIVLRLPYDPGRPGDPPQAAYFDSGAGDLVRLDSTLANGYVNITFPVGTYSSTPPLMAPAAVPVSSDLKAEPVRWGSFNQIASSLWWAVGLPNGVLVDPHFSVYYNTHDVSETYAQAVLDALNEAWNKFSGLGYTMPSNPVIVKIANWLTTGQRPGATTTLLYNYHIFLSGTLSTEMLQDTAVHEFFHVLQRKSPGYGNAPTWFREGTATWAQWVVYPGHTGYLNEISGSLDFLKTGFDSWSGLQVEQQYATMALAAYLEQKKGEGTIKSILDLMGSLSLRGALDLVTGNWGTFYTQFAKDYWMQKFAPVDAWNLEPAMQVVTVTQPSNTIYYQGTPALSSGLIKAYYGNTPNPPDSFSQGVDSVVRMPNSCTLGEAWVFDKGKNILGSFIGQIDPLGPGFAAPLRKIGNYTAANPAYFLYINGGSATCSQELVWEAPTVSSLGPYAVTRNTPTQISISGSGFGPKIGQVVAGGGIYTPTIWHSGSVTFTLPGQSTPGTITIRLQTPTGALSNPKTLTIN